MKEWWYHSSEKKKLRLTGAAAFCIALCAYFGAIQSTVGLMRYRQSLEGQKAALRDSATLSGHDTLLNTLLITTEPSLANAQTKLLYHLEQLTRKKNLKLRQIPVTELLDQEGKKVALITVKLDGKFHDQVTLVNHLEKNLGGIYLQSVFIESVLDQRTKEYHLSNSLHFKTVIL